MKKGYWVVAYRSVSNPTVAQEYSRLAGAVIAANDGKILVRGADKMEVFEAGLKERTVVIEFESFDKALATYRSDEYKKALDVLGNAAERDFRIIEGTE